MSTNTDKADLTLLVLGNSKRLINSLLNGCSTSSARAMALSKLNWLSVKNEVNPDELPLPLVLKPAVGFLSVGVYIVRNKAEWQAALDEIDRNFAKQCAVFPETVVRSEKFILEQCIEGEEYAVDAFYDAEGTE